MRASSKAAEYSARKWDRSRRTRPRPCQIISDECKRVECAQRRDERFSWFWEDDRGGAEKLRNPAGDFKAGEWSFAWQSGCRNAISFLAAPAEPRAASTPDVPPAKSLSAIALSAMRDQGERCFAAIQCRKSAPAIDRTDTSDRRYRVLSDPLDSIPAADESVASRRALPRRQ